MRPNRPSRGSTGGGRGPRRGERGKPGGATDSRPVSVTARFADVATLRRFFAKLGMPASLVRQLGYWLDELEPGGAAERMEPELTWEGREVTLGVTVMIDEDGEGVDAEFSGPASLIEALQADLDEFFRPRQEPGGKK